MPNAQPALVSTSGINEYSSTR